MCFQQLMKEVKLPLLQYKMCFARSEYVCGALQDNSAEDLEFICTACPFFIEKQCFFWPNYIF